MNVRTGVNLLLLAAVAALALLAVFGPGEKKGEIARITPLRAADIHEIDIEAANRPKIVLQRDAEDWRMRAPIEVAANEFRVQTVLRLAEAESRGGFDAEDKDLAPYGLDAPAARVTFNDIVVEFGGTEPIDGRRYVRVGARIHLVTDTYFYQVQADLPAFVSQRLLPSGADPREVRLPQFGVRLDDHDRWRLLPPAVASGHQDLSADELNRFVEAWTTAEALRVSRYRGEPAEGEALVYLSGNDAPLRFAILQQEPEVALARLDLGLRYDFGADAGRGLMELPGAEPSDTAGDP